MTARIDMGMDGAGNPVLMDLEELLATRLLVQGNSGSGKSHLLRRLLEGSAGLVQQVVIDPEGDFVSLSEAFGHVVLDASEHSEHEINRIATRIREHRASVVLSLEGLDIDAQMRCAGGFLSALFDAPRDHWYPALVVVDEAQMFAPVAAGEFSEEARRASLGAMTNLMCRGRKRGLAGVIATQRLAKLAKNVAAEASNFLMGRTFLDIDMARAADLLGMERRQAEQIRDLERGRFLALGPAVSRRPIAVRIGEVKTGARGGTPKLTPLPTAAPEDLESLLFAAVEAPPPPPPPPPPRVTSEDLIRSIARPILQPATPAPAGPQMEESERAAIISAVLAEIVADPDATYRTAAVLYQDFGLRCRMRQLGDPGLDLPKFRKRLAMARAGIFDEGDESWAEALELAGQLPEDMLGAFLMVARVAKEGMPCPSDAELAEVYGTRSPGRVRRMLSYIESRGLLVARVDLSGKRTLTLPNLGWTTAPAIPEIDHPAPAPMRGSADMGSLL
ncbi:ATP-binding protein [Sphingomonas cavernae]|uniref:ATP-binding protein n=1 Tax=Sphingomonas cavernae TaxID=2320861 RepID=A0A418W6D0_9SPHN|nr:ATP-binding protein [Sphingomonas cavernae]RJF85593.1 ATP-binding protein [Sphingomonas cavernae]